jgi:hypothetical protein
MEVSESRGETGAPQWEYFLDGYSRELQLESNGEGEGWITTAETLIFDRIFEVPEDAGELYRAMAASPDPAVRRKAVEGLEKLMGVSPHDASEVQRALLEDEDEDVRHDALLQSTYYG